MFCWVPGWGSWGAVWVSSEMVTGARDWSQVIGHLVTCQLGDVFPLGFCSHMWSISKMRSSLARHTLQNCNANINSFTMISKYIQEGTEILDYVQ